MRIQLLLIVLLGLGTSQLYSQGEANIWYFGQHAGLDFNGGTPVALTNSAMQTPYGCVSISDSAGNLQFYSNGDTIWNASHVPMANGTGLFGDAGASQHLVVEQPGNPGKYFLFTTKRQSGLDPFYTLHFSEIDMHAQAGLGEVTTTKNVFMADSMGCKMAAIRHANGSDIWLLAHRSADNTFQSFLITSTGVQPNPVASLALQIANQNNWRLSVGIMKATLDGTRLAVTFVSHFQAFAIPQINPWNGGMGFFAFDRSTGVLTPEYTEFPLNASGKTFYGVEFSPNGRYCYLSQKNKIHQADMNTISSWFLNVATTEVGSYDEDPMELQRAIQLQLAPDGKIYAARVNKDSLSVIHSPNLPAPQCNFGTGPALAGRLSKSGLPNYSPGLFSYSVIPDFEDTICIGDTASFRMYSIFQDSILWNFGDPTSGPANEAVGSRVIHTYLQPGVHTVTAYLYYPQSIDTHQYELMVMPQPIIDFGPDQVLCETDSVVLSSDSLWENLWSDGSTGHQLVIQQDGNYWLAISNQCGTDTASINFNFATPLEIDLGPDLSRCDGQTDTLVLLHFPYSSFVWSHPPTSDTSILTETSDIYWVQVTNPCGTYGDTLQAFYDEPSSVQLPDTNQFCTGDTLMLQPTTNTATFFWQDGTQSPTYPATEAGLYSIIAINHCNSDTAQLQVSQRPLPVVDLGGNRQICPGEAFMLQSNLKGVSFQWQDGSTNADFRVTSEGSYTLQVTDTIGCQDSAVVLVSPCPALYIPNAFSPDDDGLNDLFLAKGETVKGFSMMVYNRWGQQVFATNNVEQGWSGHYQGELQQQGVYAWKISYINKAQREIVLSGNVTLIR